MNETRWPLLLFRVLLGVLAIAITPYLSTLGAQSLAPPLVAILAAIATQRVLTSLFLGVLVGSWLLLTDLPPDDRPSPALRLVFTLGDALEHQIWASISEPSKLRVLAFSLLMGSMVGLLYRSGGMHGLVESLLPWANNRLRGQLLTWFLGLLIFFDDYANTILLGYTMRPITDRLKISREKLAFLVDTTSAPVAGMALVSTWVVTEVNYIEEGLTAVNASFAGEAYSVFLETIPYRFYLVWALLFVGLVAIQRRDFGPMLRAERRALDGKPTNLSADVEGRTEMQPTEETPRRWFNAVIPVLVVVFAVLGLIVYTGHNSWLERPAAEAGLEWSLALIFSKADSYLALFYGSLAGVLAALVLVRTQHLLTDVEAWNAIAMGAKAMIPGLSVLVLAWALARITDGEHLRTGLYLSQLLEGQLRPEWLPTLVFLLACGVAFATGTSWGTMGIVMPQAIPVTYQLLVDSSAEPVSVHHPILLATIGSVLAGSIFGDHCSPISDTTVLSSQSSGCDHMAHVQTQLPYALLVAVISVICGTIPVAYGVPLWLLLPLGVVAMSGSLRVLGTKLPE